MKKISGLNSGWKFSLIENGSNKTGGIKPGKWYEASVPGTIHTDLLNNGLTDDPFYSDNETRLQWIGDNDWKYGVNFSYPAHFSRSRPVSLVFEGLDTAAEISLNGKVLGSTDNMFRKYEFDITPLITEGNNELEVKFTSAVKYARKLEEKHGQLPVALRSERVYIRKAQYSFGWDWGPCYITCGIWRSVYLLQRDEVSLENVFFDTKNISDNKAEVTVRALLDKKLPKGYTIKAALKGNSSTAEKETAQQEEIRKGILLVITAPRLWYPNNYGEPYLYELTVRVLNEKGETIDEVRKKAGIRTIRLDQGSSRKRTFRFVVNDIPVFAMGANWIPSDSFLPRVKEDEYRHLLAKAHEANMNIIRIWGGGIYENEIFYNLCDELGLMVWQDFMFACAAYPETEELTENIKKEAEENIARLQHHASVAIWCGNNENEWIWYQEQKRPVSEMPGFNIFNKLIPAAVKKLDPERPYWQSTPYSYDDDPNSQTSGNRHQWDLWSRWVDYKDVKNDESLFVTEFGFQGPANYETFKHALPKKEREVQGKIFEFHNKQVDGPARLFRFMASHLPVRTDFRDFIYLAQLSQALALKECVEHWRMRWPDTNGSIIWQLNDCWPVTSWALIDSDEMPKLSYYAVKKSFAPQLIGFRKAGERLQVLLHNNSIKRIAGRLKLRYVHFKNGDAEDAAAAEIQSDPLTNAVVLDLDQAAPLKEGRCMLTAVLEDMTGNVIARNYYVMEEWKYINAAKADIKAEKEDDGILLLSTDIPALFVNLQCSGIEFDDNGFILLPGEKARVSYRTLRKKARIKDLRITCLNDFL